ncbi:MAG: 50S ribosomal protein L18 [Acidobacteriota bacterium]|nr:50S ribosomal protein L18 [Acidobacteriota bacterium]
MKSSSKKRRDYRARRHLRIRRRFHGTAERPRLVVFRSLKHLEGQLVDDDRGVTILGLSTRAGDIDRSEAGDDLEGKVADSYVAGRRLAERAREAGVETVVFDRGGYPYHGRVKAFAEGARAGGLRF